MAATLPKTAAPPPAANTISPGRAYHIARRRRRRLIRRIVIGCSLVLLVAGVVLTGPAYRRFKEWRIDKLLVEANAAVLERDWNTGSRKATTVLMDRPNDMEAGWLLFTCARQLKSPTAVEIGAWLLSRKTLTLDQKYGVLGVIADDAPEVLFFGARNLLTADEREQGRFRALFARVLIRRGQLPVAEPYLRWSPELLQEPALMVELVRLLCVRAEERDIQEAWQLFESLKSGEHTDEALEALRLIVPEDMPGRLAGAGPDISVWIRRQPEATANDLLLAVDADIVQGRKKEEEALDGVVADFRDAQGDLKSSRDPAALGDWLSRRGHPDEAIALLNTLAAKEPRAFTALAHAYIKAASQDPKARASRIAAGTRLVKEPPANINPVELEMVRIDMARARGEKAAEDASWLAAANAVARVPSKNWGFELASKAARRGRTDQWVNASAAALRHRRGPLPLYRLTIPVIAALSAQNRYQEILDICRNLSFYEQGNPDLRNNLLYLQLLYGELSPHVLVPELEKLCRANPESIEYPLSLAFAYLMDRKPEEAIKVIGKLPEDTSVPTLQRTAILGAAHRLAGRKEEGIQVLAGIQWKDPGFLRQEVVRLQELLAPLDEAIAREKAEREKAENEKLEKEKAEKQKAEEEQAKSAAGADSSGSVSAPEKTEPAVP